MITKKALQWPFRAADNAVAQFVLFGMVVVALLPVVLVLDLVRVFGGVKTLSDDADEERERWFLDNVRDPQNEHWFKDYTEDGHWYGGE